MHDTFTNVGIHFIDEKSMVGQKMPTMVSKCLQEARSHIRTGILEISRLSSWGTSAAATSLGFSDIQGKYP